MSVNIWTEYISFSNRKNIQMKTSVGGLMYLMPKLQDHQFLIFRKISIFLLWVLVQYKVWIIFLFQTAPNSGEVCGIRWRKQHSCHYFPLTFSNWRGIKKNLRFFEWNIGFSKCWKLFLTPIHWFKFRNGQKAPMAKSKNFVRWWHNS